MAVFIRFTQKVQAPGGERSSFQFVNVEHISRATYDPQTEMLVLHFAECFRTSHGPMATLSGTEAKEALEVLRKVSQ